jgi:hypothetical protein
MNPRCNLNAIVLVLVAVAINQSLVSAGDLDPPIGPVSPTMKTLDQIYDESNAARVAAEAAAQTSDLRTPILSIPYSITESGSYYLVTDLVGSNGTSGITITSDNVTIDLQGYALIGTNGSLDGIAVPSMQHNLIVLNGTIKSWGGSGLAASLCESTLIEQISAHNNGDSGIKLGNDGVAFRCTAGHNGSNGINAGKGCVISHCVAHNNTQRGISTSNGNTVVGCTVHTNSSDGILANDGTTIADTMAYLNGAYGIRIDRGTLTNCAAYQNTSNGIEPEDCVVTACVAANNGNAGFLTNDSTLISCRALSNGGHGIEAGGNCIIRQCVCSGNTDSGIQADGGGRIEENSVHDNGIYGIETGNFRGLIIKNFADGNTTANYEPGLSGLVGPISSSISTNPNANYEFP